MVAKLAEEAKGVIMSNEIVYGGHVFHLHKLYRLSQHMDDHNLRGKRVWVLRLVKQHGCDWLVVHDTEDNEWLVKPQFVLPDYRLGGTQT